MATATPLVIEKPKLDLSYLRDDHNEGGLAKEASFVGELISFDTLNTRRKSDNRRRSYSLSSDNDGQSTRRNSLQKSFSERDIRRLSSSRSPTKGRRTSLSLRNENADSPDGNATSRGRTSRRESMMNILRQDLESLPCLEAIKKRHTNRQTSTDSDVVFYDSGPDSGPGSPERTGRRMSRRRSTFRTDSRVSRHSISSYESLPGVLTEAEQRKLKMLETLSKMDGKPTMNQQRKSFDINASESSILEASFMRGKKRGSIATHILMTAKKRQDAIGPKDPSKPKVVIGKSVEPPTPRPESEIISEELKERAGRIFNMMRPSDSKLKLPGLLVKDKETVVKEDIPSNTFLGGFRRKLRRKRFRPMQVFRKKAKFVLLLLRAWKIHSNAINETLVDNNDSLDMITRANQQDLMFDVTQYKASREAKVSKEAVRILMKKPFERTEDEKHYLQIFLRNYKSIAEYPVKMQKMIAQRSWFESFDQKRVIVREGHIPMCFYFILSGSAVVSTLDNGAQRTVMFLNRGDSFGDIAILNKTRRQTTVISREKIELLCMTDTDFVDIFMSGGIRDPFDPFLLSINFLDGWPKELLVDNPKKCIFSYFKRGTVLVADSSVNEWIFVVKSGSASVLKKLTPCNIHKHPKVEKPLDFREEVMELMKHEKLLSHEEQITLMFEEEKRSLDDQNLHVRFYALPEINVKTNDGYNELKLMKEEFVNANSVTRALGDLEKMADDGVDIKSETGNSGSTQATSRRTSHPRKMSLSNVMLKGPYKQSLGRETSFVSNSSRRESLSRNSQKSNGKGAKSHRDSVVEEDGDMDHKQKVDDWQKMSLPSVAESPIRDLTIRTEPKPVFVEIRALTKGQDFGMTELLYDNQPTFSLVSNGSECIMIEKKFFLEHASQNLIVRLRDNTYPYPSDEDLQDNLESQLRWDVQKRRTVNGVVKKIESQKAQKKDMREYLHLPPLHTSQTF